MTSSLLRKRLILFLSLLLVALGVWAFPQPQQQKDIVTPTNIPTQSVATKVSLTEETVLSARDTDKGPEAVVQKVIDGDTISVKLNGKDEVVRIIGINTPETVDPRRPLQCFGKEASQKAKDLLTGQIVQLEEDATQNSRDKYGRLLRFVWLDGGTVDYGKYMLEQGYAYEYTYETPYIYQIEYRQAEQEARDAGRGLWGQSCTVSQTPEKTQDKDCKDFVTQQDAQTYFAEKGGSSTRNVENLDPDADGVACESLP